MLSESAKPWFGSSIRKLSASKDGTDQDILAYLVLRVRILHGNSDTHWFMG